MKRIIETVMMVAIVGAAVTFLFLTGTSNSQEKNHGYLTALDKRDTTSEENTGLDPAKAVKLAPFLPTPMSIVHKMLELAEVDDNDIVYDLGCGDGRIVVTAAEKYEARGVGLDIYPQWIRKSRSNAKKAGVESLVEFRLEDATKADISEATVVSLYLLPETNGLLCPILEKQLKPGSRVVTHNYHMPGWSDKEICVESLEDEFGKEHFVFVYRL